MKFKKKPVVIEAIQWTGKNCDEIAVFLRGIPLERLGFIIPDASFVIHTLEGDYRADVGDWIIKGVRGEFYPIKPDIFEATYESLSGIKEGKMAEQELREKLFGLMKEPPCRDCEYWDRQGHYCFNENVEGCILVSQILAIIKEAGYVQLAEDQKLPENPHTRIIIEEGIPEDQLSIDIALSNIEIHKDAQQDMLIIRDGMAFRKVKVEVKDG